MKISSLFLLMTLLSSTSSIAQKQVQFSGCMISQYAHPLQLSNGKHVGYYNNSNLNERGYIIINTSNKSFTIKWLNGDEWFCKYNKVETSNGNDANFGATVNTIYKGRINGEECLLLVKKSQIGCSYTFKGMKVIDKSIGLDAWRSVVTLYTGGYCI